MTVALNHNANTFFTIELVLATGCIGNCEIIDHSVMCNYQYHLCH